MSGASAQETLRRSYNDGGDKALKEGKYAEAERLFRTAIQDSTLAISLTGLARSFRYQGKYPEAEPVYKRALQLYEKFSGADSTSVAVGLEDFARLYELQAKYAEAEPLYKRSLAIKEKNLGADHSDVGILCNNLAGLYYFQRRYAEAEALYEQKLGGGWPGLERLREVPECGLHTKTGPSFAKPQSSPGHPTTFTTGC